ncbi:peptidoglycan recognition protein family protein [Rubellimicrobium arenae]|uniref:peptidoglycan recognition protein family protein n=1 Tax=Rubellimicrobium arenae TaxID=2817372 RepID=UPI001B3020AF|nr:N-acetylmuramoyl-L-alanine amidase [Rubellimicrobium arenae]
MPQCPFAEWKPITGPSGDHIKDTYRIVHHTTEGSSAEGAMSAYRKHRADPHFTVDGTTIYQHVDTAKGARALRNSKGGVQTNRLGAVQIEVVGFAGRRKPKQTLMNLARLCRWIEEQHDVPHKWPNGLPKPAKDGKDPGGHNRDATTWARERGHYGHCHVPENTHWDPAYDQIEADFLMAARFDAKGEISNPGDPAVRAFLDRPALPTFGIDEPDPMHDHFDVGDPEAVS